MSEEYAIINSQSVLDDFLDKVGGFHDAIIREARILDAGYVDVKGNMWNDFGPCDLRMLMHSQYRSPICIEIIAESIFDFNISDCGVLSGDAQVVVENNRITMKIGESGGVVISSAHMKYRIYEIDSSTNTTGITR